MSKASTARRGSASSLWSCWASIVNRNSVTGRKLNWRLQDDLYLCITALQLLVYLSFMLCRARLDISQFVSTLPIRDRRCRTQTPLFRSKSRTTTDKKTLLEPVSHRFLWLNERLSGLLTRDLEARMDVADR